jgi:leader peptidase (prepilin peptidase)/N-methyltransferase
MPGSNAPPSTMAGFVLLWAVLGAAVGVVMLVPAARTMRRETLSTIAAAVSVLATAAAFGLVALRFGPTAAIGPGTVVAMVGPPLAVVDLAERRLPWSLTLAGLLLGGCAVIVVATVSHDLAFLASAALMSITVGACYLALALVSTDGLGAGDVKLAALVGLLLSATGWWSVLLASAVTWLLALLAAVVLRVRQRGAAVVLRVRQRGAADGTVPLGPFLVAGTLVGALDLTSWSAFF